MDSNLHNIQLTLATLKESPMLRKLILGGGSNSQKKNYVPRLSTLNDIKNPKSDAIQMIREFSPFIVGETMNERDKFNKFFKIIFPFDELQIARMDEISKHIALENGLVAIGKCIEQGRHKILSWDRLFEDTYMNQRLKYVLEYGDEPKFIYNEDDFLFLRNEMLEMFRMAIKSHLRINGFGGGLTQQNVLLDFFNRCLLRFESIHEYWMWDLNNQYLLRFKENKTLTFQEIKQYQQLKECPISICIRNIGPIESFSTNSSAISKLADWVKYLRDLKEVISSENFLAVLKSIANVSLAVENFLNEGNEFNKLINENTGKRIKEIIEVLPLAAELSEY